MIIPTVIALLAAAGPQAQASPSERLQPYLAGIGVADVAASAKWYETRLGFQVYHRMELPEHGLKIVFLKSGAFRLELVEKAGAMPLKELAPNLKDDTMVLGLKKIAFVVPDLQATAARLRAQSVTFVVEPFDDKPMRLRSFIVADPDGNLVQFVQEMR